tara:strand:- start:2231 stop:2470 length:240 start_codon:yes stop_codon:yes gene_type:complete
MELLWFVLVGAAAGWFASIVMRVHGGVLFNVALGIVGGFLGGWLFGVFGVSAGEGIMADIVVAAIGAVILVWLHRVLSR